MLVFVQVVVSSTWRFAHTANTAKKPITVATTISAIEVFLTRTSLVRSAQPPKRSPAPFA